MQDTLFLQEADLIQKSIAVHRVHTGIASKLRL
ncbi:hypothetical protein LR68_03355 [Anoxybacillus sp. BCO1]|nr:hypothetical protein LR68_03355 [Anoxybacillus sp. BCO1]